MKGKKSILAILLAMMLVLVSCGGDETSTEEAGSQSTTSSESSTSAEESTSSESSSGEAGSETGTGTATGMNGDITVTVSFNGEEIADIQTEHQETEGLGDQAIATITEDVIDNQSTQVEAMAGATYSSKGFLEALNLAIENAGKDPATYDVAIEEEETSGETTERDVDVVVVGAGGAGFGAAVSAHNEGAEVLLLEKMPTVGGNTLLSGGEFAAPGNSIQEEESIEDSPELFAQDLEVAGGDPELIKVLSENALSGAEWLRDEIGVEFLDSLMFFGGHSVARSVIPQGHSGVEIIESYQETADELGIEVFTEHDVQEILMNDDGSVAGVRAETPDGELIVNAKAVVIASGGFGANDEMLYEYDKEIDDSILSTNSPGSQGDGVLMAEAVGADTVDMDQIQLYPICDPDTGKLLYVGDTRLVAGALLVNQEGERFVEELDTRRAISLAIKNQTGGVGYLIWDEKSSEETGTIYSHAGEAESLYDRGLLVKADTIDELAEHFDIDADQLKETVETFNENSAKGVDPEFNLRMLGWTISEPPYYMLKAVPAVHHTMGGIKIDPQAQVVNTDGEVIPGLYAAGEVTGGIHGENRLGSAAMADITVFGRISGTNAAQFALENK